MLGIDTKVLSRPPKRQTLIVVLQNCKKAAVKYSIKKTYVHKFMWICLHYFVQDCT